ncbi:MAG TPA: NAD(P)-dependent oxidoreductase [Alphaproteobacteria bacterium]|nr:NAD(P)-dependent oxidoreductase [Alphaproteobacteria bacterium]
MGSLEGRKIGFIGAGVMGRWMIGHLSAAGAELTIHNRTRAKAEALAAPKIRVADSVADAARSADMLILMVTDTAAVESALLGKDGAAQALKIGALVIDMGTTAVAATRAFAEHLAGQGVDYVDAPVSGGEPAAREARLTIMAGGSDAAIARAHPVLEVLGSRITHVGEVGAGQVAKAANQIIVALTIGAVAEAFALARRAGVDPARVREAIRGGFAESRILEIHGERMVTGSFQPGGRVRIQRKDVDQALGLARSVELELPASRLSLTLWDEMIARGWGDLDHSALIKLIEAGVAKR